MDAEKKAKLKKGAKNELRELGIVCGYLFLVFASTALQRSVILAQHDIDLNEFGFALINSLAIGKVMLIAQQLHFAQWWRTKPLIVSTIAESFAFALLLLICKVLEDVGVDMYRGKTFMESLPKPAGHPFSELLAVCLVFFIALIPFFAFSELSGALGEGAIVAIFSKPAVAKKS